MDKFCHRRSGRVAKKMDFFLSGGDWRRAFHYDGGGKGGDKSAVRGVDKYR